ncbi:MAG: glycosyltransferase family 2 protein, partial [Pirellulaceae bacterium]
FAQPETGEVILVEDASPDNSLEVCRQLEDRYETVRLLRHPGGANQGAAASRNLGIRAARYELIAFLDADDYYVPGRFSTAMQVLAEQPDAEGVYEAVGTVHETLEMEQWWRENREDQSLTTISAKLPPDQLLRGITCQRKGHIHTNGITVRKTLFQKTGLFDVELRMCQDSAMWLKMAAVGRLYPGRLDQAVAIRRVHGENRIYRYQDMHLDYQRQQKQLLVEWGAKKGLEPRKMKCLVRSLIAYRFFDFEKGSIRSFRQAGAALKFLASVGWRYPIALRTVMFWFYLCNVMQIWRLADPFARACGLVKYEKLAPSTSPPAKEMPAQSRETSRRRGDAA